MFHIYGSTGLREADYETQAFWRELANADCTKQLLTLKQGTFFLGQRTLSSQLMIRPMYERIERGIEQLWNAGYWHTFIVGNPGK